MHVNAKTKKIRIMSNVTNSMSTTQAKEKHMRIIIMAIAAAFVACTAVPGLAAPKKALQGYNDCQALAMQRGIVQSERRSSEAGPSPFRQFMVSCLAGQIADAPRTVTASSRPLTAAQIQSRWERCDTLAMQRGLSESEHRSSEGGVGPFGQFMRACLRGQIPG
jgi:hypothetical protein